MGTLENFQTLKRVKLDYHNFNPICIPADSSRLLTGTVANFLEGTDVLVEFAEHLTLPSGIVVCPTLCRVTNGKGILQVCNYSSISRVWTQAHEVAKLSPCRVLDPESPIFPSASCSFS